jgi:hypothetical protein
MRAREPRFLYGGNERSLEPTQGAAALGTDGRVEQVEDGAGCSPAANMSTGKFCYGQPRKTRPRPQTTAATTLGQEVT